MENRIPIRVALHNAVVVVLLMGLFFPAMKAQSDTAHNLNVTKITQFENLFFHGGTYISEQPTLEAVHWLNSQGVQCVISLRSKKEMTEFEKKGFSEPDSLKTMGIKFVNIPVSGTSDYNPRNLKKLSRNLEKYDTVLVHCKSAGRATWFYMGYLVDRKGYTLNEAVTVGKQMRYTFLLEKLLDREIMYKFAGD